MLTPAFTTAASLLAQVSGGDSAPAEAPNMLIIVGATLVIFYLVAFLPERKARKKKEAMLEAVKKNDRVLTSSGMYATVAALGEQDITIKFDDGPTRVRILRSSISVVLDKDGEAAD
ncbi:MAG: preprotein translocase subunit YajC [Pseudohongiellaceae bacterium]|jgi:preprotein translocase subunit YajC